VKFLRTDKIIFDILWVCLMAIMCFVDIYILSLGWNLLSLIGLICCGISLIMTVLKICISVKEHIRNCKNS
jgi:hypothetical protein